VPETRATFDCLKRWKDSTLARDMVSRYRLEIEVVLNEKPLQGQSRLPGRRTTTTARCDFVLPQPLWDVLLSSGDVCGMSRLSSECALSPPIRVAGHRRNDAPDEVLSVPGAA
jgi:hypothetical protein